MEIRNILIIDDEREICILLSHLLTKRGYSVDCSHSLQEGINKVRNNTPDLVLLDLHLPDGSGVSIIPRIRQLQSDVLVISAYDDTRNKVLKLGASDFVKKPFDLQTLLGAINSLETEST